MNGRDKRRAKARRNAAREPKPVCSHCGEQGRHFVPPSLGEPGFFTCKRLIADRSRLPNSIPDLLPDLLLPDHDRRAKVLMAEHKFLQDQFSYKDFKFNPLRTE